MNNLKIGLIGTDTTHAVAFTDLINNVNNIHYIAGGQIIAAYPGGSHDFPLSFNRVEGFMERLSSEFGVIRMDSLEELAARSDAIMLESADGRVHLEQFRTIASYGKPVFIDKPLALNYQDALDIKSIAELNRTPIMSCSALRYAEQLTQDLECKGRSGITSAEVFGPLNVEPTQSYFFWYGIHSVEMLYAIMGAGCLELKTETYDGYNLITGHWRDGRIGTVRCNHNVDSGFGATIHRDQQASFVDIQAGTKPFYASLLEHVVPFLKTGLSPVDWRETVEIIRFLEAAEQSRQQGNIIQLEGDKPNV